jgi:hypothetical protein
VTCPCWPATWCWIRARPADDELARFLDPGPAERKLVKKVGGLKVGNVRPDGQGRGQASPPP